MNVDQMMDDAFKGVAIAQDNARIATEAIRQRDELRAALTFLYEQVCSLEDYKVTRDIEKYKAEAVFDDAIEQARKALKL